MKQFIGFVRKEFYHIFRDYRTSLILFGMPVVQLLIFGFALTNDIKNARIAILDYSKDPVTSKLTHKILSSGYFILAENLDSETAIEAAFKQGNIKQVLIFEPDFAEKIERNGTASLQILADASDPNVARILTNYTMAIISNFQKELFSDKKLPIEVRTEVKMLYNAELRSVFMFVPGVITVLLLLISAMMTSISIAREKEMGTMEVLLVSPLRPIQIIIGKVVPYVLLAFMIAVMILILGFFVFGVPVRGSLVLLLGYSVLYIILALSLGIFISSVVDTQQVAMLISMVALMLPSILLSGFIFPIENMPWPLQWISNVIPAKWFIIVLRGVMLKGIGLGHLWKETLILTGMIIFFIALSVRKFKIRLA
ncbi:MAG: ABC transporter permease [Bacteroidales bacterium]|nr:ABC transporter permease [Bacteroidales bacterium]